MNDHDFLGDFLQNESISLFGYHNCSENIFGLNSDQNLIEKLNFLQHESILTSKL